MFLGTYSPRLDTKGRIILPAKFREELSAGLVLTRGQERCLYVFSAEEFERIHEQMRSAPLSSRQARDYMRVFLSGASDEVPDKQGRVTIPAALREYARLDRELVVIGQVRVRVVVGRPAVCGPPGVADAGHRCRQRVSFELVGQRRELAGLLSAGDLTLVGDERDAG